MSPIVEEDDMPASLAPSWRLHRQPTARPDGQQRWDRAYQLLFQWSQPTVSPAPFPCLQRMPELEDSDDYCPVRACLDATPNLHPDD
jgi:hypothetical protein